MNNRKQIIAHISVEDISKLNELYHFISVWKYSDNGKHYHYEWGKMVFGDTDIIFYVDVEVEILKKYKIKT